MEDVNGEAEKDRKGICNILQDQYVSVFSNPSKYNDSGDDIGSELVVEDDLCCNNIDFSTVDISRAISDIPSNSAPGPDGITPKILKECKESLSYPLFLMWKKSLEIGEIPNLCKLSFIVPIHKKGRKDKPENYRPISLTSQIIKLFERVIKICIVNYLESNDLIGNFQHGFRSKRSCLTQLLNHYTKIFDKLNSGSNVDVIYLDFARAFDKVDHIILLKKGQKS